MELSHRRLSLVYSTFWYCHLRTKTETNRHLNICYSWFAESDELLTISCHLLYCFSCDSWIEVKEMQEKTNQHNVFKQQYSYLHTDTVCHSETTGQIFRGITPLLCLTICPLAHRTYPMRLSLYNKFLSSLSSFLKLINHFEDTKSEGIEKLNIYHKSRLIFWLYLGSFSSLFPCTVMQITGNNKELQALTNSQIKMSDFC